MTGALVQRCVFVLILSSFFGNVLLIRFQILNNTTWHDGVQLCKDNGMEIAIFDSKESTDHFLNYLMTDYIGTKEFWFGLFWDSNLQMFNWTNNSTLGAFNSWSTIHSEPNCMNITCPKEGKRTCDICNQNCVRGMYETGDFLWLTRSCSALHSVVCSAENGPKTLDFTSDVRSSTVVSSKSTEQTSSTLIKTTIMLPTSTIKRITTHKKSFDQKSTISPLTQSISSYFTQRADQKGTKPVPTMITKSSDQRATFESTNPVWDTTTEDTVIETTITEDLTSEGLFHAYVSCPASANSLCACKVVERNRTKVGSIPPFDYLYRIDQKQTTSYKRRHISVYDGRLSAKVMGYAGLSVLLIVIFVIVSFDLKWLYPENKKKN